MVDHRKHSRSKFELECYLKINTNGTFKGLLGNLSLSGALIIVGDSTPFQIGDLCELMLGEKSQDAFIKHDSEVAWVDTGNIGLKFIT